jgi:hypothetical protein
MGNLLKRHIISACLLLAFAEYSKAERVNAVAEVYESESSSSQAIAYLEKGAELWIEEDKGGKRVAVYIKAWVHRKEVKRGVAEANAQLYDGNGKAIGRLYKSRGAAYDTTSGFSRYSLVLKGYIFKDRIDPASIVEKELEKLLDAKKGKITREEMEPFFKKFVFQAGGDTLDFSFFYFYEKENIRMSLVFKKERLIAVVPEKEILFRHYLAEQKQSGYRIIYFEKLPPDEESFLGSYIK